MSAAFSLRLGQLQSPAQESPPEAGLHAFSAMVDRLEALLDEETAALRDRAALDFADMSRRKRQSLLELSRSLPQLQALGAGAGVRDRLEGLGTRLERNRAALDIQLAAVREVAGIIERTMRDAESDGTYSYASAWQ